MTMRPLGSLFALVLLAAFPLCSQPATTATRVTKERVPVWWGTSPKGQNVSWIKAKARSADKQLALDKAAASARADLAATVESRWQSLLRAIRDENPQLPQPPTFDTSAALRGTRVAKQVAYRAKKLWTGYVILEYPVHLIDDCLLQRLHAMPAWYAAVKETRAVRSLENRGR